MAVKFEILSLYSTEEDIVDFGSNLILRPDQILNVMKSLSTKETITVGFTGYPNVGKSSTINRFLESKKLQVSATPGKTKHFQTHVIGGSCIFIDGPGLVIPNLSMTRASMVLGGILPIGESYKRFVRKRALVKYQSPKCSDRGDALFFFFEKQI